MEALNTYFKDEKEFSAFKKGFMQSSSFYREAKAKFATNSNLVKYFLEKTPKEIYSDLLTGEEQKKYPLTVERKRTPIGDQINNLKRYAKKLVNGSDEKTEKKAKTIEAIAKYLKDIEADKMKYTKSDLSSIASNLLSTIKSLTGEEWILKNKK